jgi:hypothetical protein
VAEDPRDVAEGRVEHAQLVARHDLYRPEHPPAPVAPSKRHVRGNERAVYYRGPYRNAPYQSGIFP